MVGPAPSLMSVATRMPLVQVGESKLSSSLLALRGGGAVGPLDANVVVILNMVMTGLYAMEMLFPSLTHPSAKYFGAPASPWTKWFGLALVWVFGLTWTCKYKFGVSDVDLLKWCTLQCLSSVALQAYEVYTKSFKTKQPLYVLSPLLLLTAYVAFS
mmetsp:Transcript_25010/g.64547  ORF Transcript_25010/g.64547 Transcript_25010/m.64547 type:complete len:157 (+) Transcript_25010:100-570(+)|eukprot:CAMPEP_0119406742 /NCGR_PEP_ID=MMETSP1335-20130426/951_1 /TAXON_ID=259385 /ORGANISM="Chrysoculter rhomboideus, Strain RCC1486" /LENGTH=156 /DNA_ID=CAMNT_0007430833 /DNA_START=82 /DNA_END=552 /DNA_ORIENTATION=-